MTREGALGANLCKKLGCLDSGFRVKGTLSRVETLDPSIVDLHCDKLREYVEKVISGTPKTRAPRSCNRWGLDPPDPCTDALAAWKVNWQSAKRRSISCAYTEAKDVTRVSKEDQS
jgi:hypothetical protein